VSAFPADAEEVPDLLVDPNVGESRLDVHFDGEVASVHQTLQLRQTLHLEMGFQHVRVAATHIDDVPVLGAVRLRDGEV
jgi:hypothetical protein